MIQDVVGERAGRAGGRAAGDLAKAIVAARTEYILKHVYIRCFYDYISYHISRSRQLLLASHEHEGLVYSCQGSIPAPRVRDRIALLILLS